MSRTCPTCGCIEACYHDEHAHDEMTEIPEEVMAAGYVAAVKSWPGPHDKTAIMQMVEDIHRAMHGREKLHRRADRDFTKRGLERWK